MQQILLKIRFFEDSQKAFKKLTLFFLSNSVLFYGKSYKKQKEPRTSAQLLRKMFRKVSLLVIYYLTMFDDII